MTAQTKRVLVTGAGDSVGRTIAETFAARGDLVHICDLREEAVSETLKANSGMTGSVADVSRRDDVDRVFEAVTDTIGGVDYLINVVGAAGPRDLIEKINLDEWEMTFAVNVTGMLAMMQRVIPGMKQRRSGAIVNFSSASTLTALPSRAAYVASKFAVEGLTKNAARELGPFGISCNALLPGFIDNDRARQIIGDLAQEKGISIDEALAESLRYTSMRTMISGEELAAMVTYLCSPAGRHISGQMIAIDGHSEWEE